MNYSGYMKKLLLIGLAAAFFGCNDNGTTVIEHALVVTPKTLTFAHGVSSQNLSITHTCSCPFSWNANPLDTDKVLQAASGFWDSSHALITIDRSQLKQDTLHSRLQIISNGYGTDTIAVTVLR